MEQDSQSKILERARQAKTLRANTFLPAVLDQQRAVIIQRWEAAHDLDTREQCWNQLQALNELAGAIDDGIKRAIERAGREP